MVSRRGRQGYGFLHHVKDHAPIFYVQQQHFRYIGRPNSHTLGVVKSTVHEETSALSRVPRTDGYLLHAGWETNQPNTAQYQGESTPSEFLGCPSVRGLFESCHYHVVI